MAIEARSPDVIVFKKAKYTFIEDIVLPLCESYVPDWDLTKAVKESLQNAYDEAWISNAKAYVTEENDAVYLRDTGTGVHWSSILLIGESGKRDQVGVVGTHGEGEIISFLVSARENVRKWMSSQDWLLEGRIGLNEHGKRVLVLARYETCSMRKGTRWYYQNPDTWAYTIKRAFENAKDAFSNHAAVTKSPKRIFKDYGNRSCLMTNGQKVMNDYRLVLGYNLLMHPGRDRSVFSLSDETVRTEIAEILETEADEYDVKDLLYEGRYGTSKLEFELELPGLDPNIVKKAAKLHEKEEYPVCWAIKDVDAAKTADAVESGNCRVLTFDQNAPLWIRRGIPHVSSFVRSYAKENTKKRIAKQFGEAVNYLISDVYQIDDVKIEMHNPLSENVIADANHSTRLIRFDWKQSKNMTISDLFETLGHELAHVVSCAEDCTRAHTTCMGTLMAKATHRLVTDKNALSAYRKAETRMTRYNKTQD